MFTKELKNNFDPGLGRVTQMTLNLKIMINSSDQYGVLYNEVWLI